MSTVVSPRPGCGTSVLLTQDGEFAAATVEGFEGYYATDVAPLAEQHGLWLTLTPRPSRYSGHPILAELSVDEARELAKALLAAANHLTQTPKLYYAPKGTELPADVEPWVPLGSLIEIRFQDPDQNTQEESP